MRCPRCQRLLAPSARRCRCGDYPPTRPPAVAAAQRLPPADRLPVDRGPTRTTAAAARRRRPLGPTPDTAPFPAGGSDGLDRAHCTGRTPFGREGLEAAVQATLLAFAAIFALAAAAHVLRYVLLLVNRNTLLPP